MIVTAALAWFDEAPEDLDAYVRALPVLCDRLVAVDGGYARYPGATPRGSKDEEHALREAASDVGLDIDIVIPKRVWRGQIEKRSFLYERAVGGSDWIGTFDTDHILRGVRDEVRAELERVTEDSAAVNFFTPLNPDRTLEDTAATSWHVLVSGRTIRQELLLKALPGIRVERFHWYVSALKGDRRVWLTEVWDGTYQSTQAHELQSDFLVEHRCMFRRDQNILGNREFCLDRVEIVSDTGQEDAA